ncbi:uridine kinase-like protein 5 [Tanacetum coccineum]
MPMTDVKDDQSAPQTNAEIRNNDSFYHSLNDEQSANPQEHNFDHPDSFNMELLLSCLETLKMGEPVNIPSYDYKIHKNSGPGRMVSPSDVIILEGILVLHEERVRDLMNIKIFVDSDSDVRLGRRIKRDTVERGRNIQYVLDQYDKHVKPSFEEFILPSKKHADIIIPRGADNDVAIDLIVQHIRTKLGQHDLCKIYQNLFLIPSTFQIRGMHTLIRDVKTRKHDFVFYADRLIRLVVEHGLGHLPFTEKQIITPTTEAAHGLNHTVKILNIVKFIGDFSPLAESVYTGVVFCKRLCGVAVIRSGESMENALRACCKGIKIGKVLIQREGNGRQLIYEKLPRDIESRQVLLLDPVLASGDSAVEAISLLLSKGVSESNIIFLNLIAAPEGIHAVCRQYPRLKIVTSEIDAGLNEHSRVIPGMGEFGDRYFGTGGSETDPFVPKSKAPNPALDKGRNSLQRLHALQAVIPSVSIGMNEDVYIRDIDCNAEGSLKRAFNDGRFKAPWVEFGPIRLLQAPTLGTVVYSAQVDIEGGSPP